MLSVFLTHNPEDLASYYAAAIDELRSVAAVVLNPLPRDLRTDELIAAAAECDVIVAHRSTPGEAALFDALPRLTAFLRTAVDVSTIDVPAASRAGVLVCNAPKSFVPTTAEMALGLMVALARNVGESVVDYRAGVEPPQRVGIQLRGRTAGVIGFGAIARYLSPILQAMGMAVLVSDPHVDATADGFEQVALDELLRRSDVVLPLAASLPSTHHLIDESAIRMMRRGTLLVNVSRGELLDEAAVAAALDSGHLGGLAVDVGSAPDQRPPVHLAQRPGVVATPHLGGCTPESVDAQALSSVEQVRALVAGVMPPRAVNPESAARLRNIGIEA